MDQPVAAEIVNLHKTFKTGLGKPVVHAVRGIDMNIRQGEVYGLIGPNGSGKSTLMKALLGLVRPTEGSCSIFGRSSLAPDSKEEVGFLPENPYFYKFLTGAETVSFYGRLCGLSGKSLKEKVRELLELVGLADAADRRLGGYSKGMLQRIGMAQALVQSPRLLVLDEPTAGVDPLGSRDIRNIIENLKGRGMTVFLCSHLLEQVQEVCDRVGVIFKGLLIAEGSVNELTRDSDKQEIIPIADRLSRMGFELYGTSGTANVLNHNMIATNLVRKISEGEPNTITLLESGKIHYMISTSEKGRMPARDSVKMRRKSVERSICCLTAIDTASALSKILESGRSIDDVELVDITKI